jgi:hypothetical protein
VVLEQQLLQGLEVSLYDYLGLYRSSFRFVIIRTGRSVSYIIRVPLWDAAQADVCPGMELTSERHQLNYIVIYRRIAKNKKQTQAKIWQECLLPAHKHILAISSVVLFQRIPRWSSR